MQPSAPPSGMTEIRDAVRRDLRATAALHRSSLPGGFFSRLGRRFLRRYHATFLASPHAVAVVATDPADGDAPAAFLVGTLANRAHYRWVVRRCGPRLALELVAALVVRPRLAWLFVRTRVGRYLRWVWRYPLRRAQRRTAPPAGSELGSPAEAAVPGRASTEAERVVEAPPIAPVAVLTHVVVDPRLRGQGAGRRLVEVFVERAREAGAAEVRLVTEASDGASGFYERLGWTPVGEKPGADDEVVREFRLSLVPPVT
jgi:ribosomal protein S18 acetylase RimI-like enzyme